MGHARHLIALVGVVIGFALSATPASATLSPSTSLFLYRPGHAITATLSGGYYLKKSKFSTSGWTHAAASRDTLALYNANTGKLKLGTFRNGIFKATTTKTIATGYTGVVASCDTIMFYNASTTRLVTATLKGGHLGVRTAYTLHWTLNRLAASCDSVQLMNAGDSFAIRGTLVNGLYTYVAGNPTAAGELIAATDDSLLILAGSQGNFYRFVGGLPTAGTSAVGFGPWDIVAGVSDSLLFYNSEGTAARATFTNGSYVYVGSGPNLAPGLTIIAGGK